MARVHPRLQPRPTPRLAPSSTNWMRRWTAPLRRQSLRSHLHHCSNLCPLLRSPDPRSRARQRTASWRRARRRARRRGSTSSSACSVRRSRICASVTRRSSGCSARIAACSRRIGRCTASSPTTACNGWAARNARRQGARARPAQAPPSPPPLRLRGRRRRAAMRRPAPPLRNRATGLPVAARRRFPRGRAPRSHSRRAAAAAQAPAAAVASRRARWWTVRICSCAAATPTRGSDLCLVRSSGCRRTSA